MRNQLIKWGLTQDDAELLGWEEVARIDEPGLPPLRAVRIPYCNPFRPGHFLPAVGGNDFLRYRVLPDPLTGRLALGTPRYLQPKGTGVEAYFPPNMNWLAVASDPRIPCIITEGEAKAARGCKDFFPTIGLGGVNSFQDLKNGYTACPSLMRFPWRGRPAVIVFDSDVCTNANVVSAMNGLAECLLQLGAVPMVAFLPAVGTEKTGLDDFLRDNGPGALAEILNKATPLGAVESLVQLNENYAVIKATGNVFNRRTKSLMTISSFSGVAESAKKCVRYDVKVSKKEGERIVPKIVPAAQEWLTWPMRAEYGKVIYEPGKPEVVEGNLNSWAGWGGIPREGDCRLFVRLINYMFGANDGDKHWFLQWLAYPLQHPGVKMFTACVLFSIEHGTGKSFLGEIMGKIYGENYVEVVRRDFASQFNTWSRNRQFVLGDEITSSDKREEADNIKRLITASELRINEKYAAEYVIRDSINYLFTTNHPDAFFMEDNDRRFFIHEITTPKLDDVFFSELHDWIHGERGFENVFHYLLNYDLTGFNPRARARQTLAKSLMFEYGLGDLATWVRSVLMHPDETLVFQNVPVERDVFSASELLQMYDPSQRSKVTQNGMARELARVGLRPLLHATTVMTSHGRQKVYAVRRRGEWEAAPYETVKKHCSAAIGGIGKY